MKMRVGISLCLLGHPVRYDGRDKFDPLPARELAEWIEWVPVCPETEFGLPTPREPIQLEDDPDRPELRGVRSGTCLSCAMRAFCCRRAQELGNLGLAGFVFKAKSPSCGLHTAVHRGEAIVGYAPGLFAAAWMELHPELPAVEAEALHDPAVLGEFLAKLKIEQ